MASNNVAQFAAELKMPAGVLLEQLQAAGVTKANEDDTLSETDKARLLDHLRKSHGSTDADKRKITLTKRHTSEIKQSDSTGKARTIQVEVRKKRTFVRRDEAAEQGADASVQVAEVDEAELQRREEEARHEAELLEKQALELKERQERLEREEAERRAREEAAEAERRRAEEEAAKKRSAADTAAAHEVAAQAVEAEAREPEQEDEQRAAAERAAQREAAKKAEDAAREASEKTRAEQQEVSRRRAAAEAEARAIREMMSTPRKVPVKTPEPVAVAKPVEPPKAAEAKGTLHKPARPPGEVTPRPVAKKTTTTTTTTAAPSTTAGDKKKPGGKGGWQDDAAKRRGIKTRGDTSGGVDRGWRGGPKGRGKHQDATTFQAPVEPIVREVHVPETITVADLAHKMAVKASEVIKVLMKLGQMVTINQMLDQETAMIIV